MKSAAVGQGFMDITAPGGRLRLALATVAIVAGVIVGVPIQWVAIKLKLPISRTLPVLFHRYLRLVLGLRVTTVGTLPAERPLLIVSNHVSWLDIVVIGSLMPLSFVAKSEIAGWPVFGTLARLQRSVFVDRKNRAATDGVNRAIAERLADGDPIVLFAEATTGDHNRTLPFRSALIGAAGEVLGAGHADRVLLLPMSVAYVGRNGLPLARTERPDVAWFADVDLLPHIARNLRSGPMDARVSFGEPIAFDAASDRKATARAAEQAVRRLTVTAQTGREPAV